MAKITLDKLARMVQTGFNQLTSQFNELRQDVNALKHGQKELKGGLEELRISQEELRQGQEEIHIKLDRRASDFEVKELTKRVDKLESK